MKFINMVVLMFVISIVQLDAKTEQTKIAVVSDAHVLDIKNQFEDSEFKGIDYNDEYYTIRSMDAQLISTRLFNENYFAFITILEELASQGISLVLFTGDLTDDGQLMNLEFIDQILSYYEENYQMQFLILPGNHEPVNPNDVSDTLEDFLDQEAYKISVSSSSDLNCKTNCTSDLNELGYANMAMHLKDYGYLPEKSHLYYDTPYITYDYASYDYQTALDEADVENRQYEMCTQGTGGEFKKADYTNCQLIYDMTYVVEPIQDLLILMIDGNVFVPNETGFDSPSSAGYNKMITHKQQTLLFIEQVAQLAESTGKTLITATHYPTVDFYDQSSDLVVETFSNDGLEMDRNPVEHTSSVIADLGVGLHLSGHLHYNDTGVYQDDENYMVNVALSSTAGYVPSYKVITIKEQNVFEIETRVLEEVKDFDLLFDFYQKEHDVMKDSWDDSILLSKNYLEFNENHIEYLARNRHFDSWPEELKSIFSKMNLYQILGYSQTSGFTVDEYLSDQSFVQDKVLDQYNIDKQILIDIDGMTVVEDFYKIMTADELAFKYISKDSINAYSFMYSYYHDTQSEGLICNIFELMYNMSNDYPSDKFIVDIGNKTVTDISFKEQRISYIKPKAPEITQESIPSSEVDEPDLPKEAKNIDGEVLNDALNPPEVLKTGYKNPIALVCLMLMILLCQKIHKK